MKSIKQINDRIAELSQLCADDINLFTGVDHDLSKEEKKAGKELKMLMWARNILEGNPSLEYLNSEHKRLIDFIDSKESQFDYWKKNVGPKNKDLSELKSLFRKETGITEAKKHLKALTYLLT